MFQLPIKWRYPNHVSLCNIKTLRKQICDIDIFKYADLFADLFVLMLYATDSTFCNLYSIQGNVQEQIELIQLVVKLYFDTTFWNFG